MSDDDLKAMSATTIRELAAERGLELTDAQVADVRAFQDAMAPDIERMRNIPLHVIDNIRLPSDAFAWVETYPEIDAQGRVIGEGA